MASATLDSSPVGTVDGCWRWSDPPSRERARRSLLSKRGNRGRATGAPHQGGFVLGGAGQQVQVSPEPQADHPPGDKWYLQGFGKRQWLQVSAAVVDYYLCIRVYWEQKQGMLGPHPVSPVHTPGLWEGSGLSEHGSPGPVAWQQCPGAATEALVHWPSLSPHSRRWGWGAVRFQAPSPFLDSLRSA